MIKLKIIYLGHITPQNIVKESTAVSVAGNNMEIGILEEIEKIYKKRLNVFSVFPFASFPRSSRVAIREKKYNEKNIHINSIPYINIFFIKQISIIIYVFLMLFKELRKENFKTKITVISYNSPTIYSLPITIMSRVFKNKIIKVCLVVDIPIIFQKKKGVYEVARKLENLLSLKLFNKYDGMITLVENTVTDYSDVKKYIRINYAPTETKKINIEASKLTKDKINLTFTGAVEEYYGIKEMIGAMKYLNADFRLNIFGSGSLDDFIKEQSILDPRIIHHGRVTHEVSVMEQENSDLLILVRTDELLNQYGLPSKIIEYLSSGTPVLSNKIASVPSELYKFLNFYEEVTEQEIAEKIKLLTVNSSNSSLKNRANEAKKFINMNYTWRNQAEKIKKFISCLNKEV